MANFMDKINEKLKGNKTAAPAGTATAAPKKSFSFNDILQKATPRNMNSRLVPEEINLVPDIKNEMIRTLKLRNFVFFLSIVVASASVAAILIFASIAGGQQAIADGKKNTINTLSKKLNDYSDLSDFLTIKDQLGNISKITDNKKLLSRTFNILSALMPTSGDTVKISELSINLSLDAPTLSFDAQADAVNPPYIDYNVLDAFKKSMQYMRYDYGNYVDKEGAEIPAYCMIENDTDGATFSDPEKGYYAYWLITGDGCNPSYEEEDDEELAKAIENANKTNNTNTNNTNAGTNININNNSGTDNTNNTSNSVTEATAEAIAALRLAHQTAGYTTEDYQGQTVVKIWRTPQYSDWYKEKPKSTDPQMTLDGEITNVAHFASQCTTYSGEENEVTGEIEWKSENDSCLLVPDGIDGINISDSSNGRGSSGELVLRFSAVITLNPDVYSFNNKHVLALGPSGRYNVTDSFVQIQNMFEERAADCAPGDTACGSTSNSSSSNTNNSQGGN